MGFFSKFERRVEDGFDEMGDKFFDAPINPVQIAKKAEKQMRREKMVGAGKEFAPTLYTVLVNPEDDERLFGYYPTLAGETETYLRAKAQELDLTMDGAPLVRFIIDDELKHGKFDVVAELVSAPIVAQLRAEEMQRYGLEARQASAMPPQAAPINNMNAGVPQPQPQPQPAPVADPYSRGVPSPNNMSQGYQDNNPANRATRNAPVAAPINNMAPGAAGAAGAYASRGVDVMAEDPMAHANAAMPGQGGMRQTTRFDEGATMVKSQMPMGHHISQQPRLIDLTTNRSFPLAKDRIVLGRALSSDIAIEDLNVSRTHAEIRQEAASAWSIADLGSTNGTLVNGRHIASVMLQEGDRVTIGTTTFLFTFQ